MVCELKQFAMYAKGMAVRPATVEVTFGDLKETQRLHAEYAVSHSEKEAKRLSL